MNEVWAPRPDVLSIINDGYHLISTRKYRPTCILYMYMYNVYMYVHVVKSIIYMYVHAFIRPVTIVKWELWQNGSQLELAKFKSDNLNV